MCNKKLIGGKLNLKNPSALHHKFDYGEMQYVLY